jgi:hypothetical protein
MTRNPLWLLLLGASAACATDLPLPAGYPTLLGVSCGGVHVTSYVTGFDAAGNITGELYAWTACGGSGRGGGYKVTHYQSWHSITWALGGTYLVSAYDGVVPDTTFTDTDQYGNYVYDTCSGTSFTQPACRAGANIVYVPSGQPPVAPVAPSVVGLTAAAATAAIQSAGLVASPYYTVTTSVPAGTVFYQTPAAGAQLTPGATVSIGVARAAPSDD